MSLRNTTPRKLRVEDLYQGHCKFYALLTDIIWQDVETCELIMPGELAEVKLVRRDGTRVPGPQWSRLEALGVILFMENQGLAPDQRSLVPGAVAAGAELDALSGLLPPEIAALRCDYALPTPAGTDTNIQLSVSVIRTEDVESIGMEEGA